LGAARCIRRQKESLVETENCLAVDCFLQVDDQTFTIVEHLRHFLSQYNTLLSILARITVGMLVTYSAGSTPSFWRGDQRSYPEYSYTTDVEVGSCFGKVGVPAGRTLDEKGRERFRPLSPNHHLMI
jgi:hypothetical protein